jgi:hypothetical protein
VRQQLLDEAPAKAGRRIFFLALQPTMLCTLSAPSPFFIHEARHVGWFERPVVAAGNSLT